jgi:hypothetical protein
MRAFGILFPVLMTLFFLLSRWLSIKGNFHANKNSTKTLNIILKAFQSKFDQNLEKNFYAHMPWISILFTFLCAAFMIASFFVCLYDSTRLKSWVSFLFYECDFNSPVIRMKCVNILPFNVLPFVFVFSIVVYFISVFIKLCNDGVNSLNNLTFGIIRNQFCLAFLNISI